MIINKKLFFYEKVFQNCLNYWQKKQLFSAFVDEEVRGEDELR